MIKQRNYLTKITHKTLRVNLNILTLKLYDKTSYNILMGFLNFLGIGQTYYIGFEKISFNETSVYETPKGDLVAFLRTADFEDQASIARSVDGRKSFGKWMSMSFQGHILQMHCNCRINNHLARQLIF
jgi:hypothetical protein